LEKTLIDLRGITKSFDGELILDDLNLSIRENSFVTLLGPSGCGKTTTLRIIGGFVHPDKGQVFFEGKDITNLPANKRQLNTVFQKYALFPHMNIAENIAFGLRIRNKSEAYIRDKIQYALKLVNLQGYEKRSVTSLSGGQQQRIAIARAIVNEPRVLLLDEPLGALDLKLRQEMQYELIRLKNELGITFIYVTHDQEEAMELGHRIGIMEKGKILQIGSGEELYLHPKNDYIRRFFGEYFVLFLEGKKHFLRPEDFGISSEKARVEPLSGRQEGRRALRKKGNVLSEVFLASYRLYRVNLSGQEVHIKLQANAPFRRGEEVEVFFYEKEEEQ